VALVVVVLVDVLVLVLVLVLLRLLMFSLDDTGVVGTGPFHTKARDLEQPIRYQQQNTSSVSRTDNNKNAYVPHLVL
jgi:hypothetical protein